MFLYQVIEQTLYHVDIGSYISYGLRAISLSYGVFRKITEVYDVSTDRRAVALLAEQCTKEQLYPVHLMDVIEDFLS